VLTTRFCETEPLYVAVIVAVTALDGSDVEIAKPAKVEPELIVTLAGTVTYGLLLESCTTTLDVGTLDRAMVPLSEVPPTTEDLKVTPDSV
jgi:hypothetical protein